MKGISILRILLMALLPFCLLKTSQAGFKEWLSSKLPYKLPPEKLQFSTLKPESAVEVLDRNHERLFYLSGSKLRFYRNLSEISQDLQKFVVLSEDAKFYSHEGFDVEEIENSLKKNLAKGKIKRGGSTITQQLAKNIFLDKKKSVTRKLFEVPWAMQLERDLSKKQILELYLNVIEWGPGIYGAEAASRHFFDKSAAEIDAREALYLAMIIPNPPRFDGYANAKMKAFIWKKSKTFTERIYQEKKLNSEERSFLLSMPADLAPLVQKERRYPLQHSANYMGSRKDFKNTWGELADYIRKSPQGKKNPVFTFLDKHFDEALWQVPLAQEKVKSKKVHAPYLVFRDVFRGERGVAAYKKLPKGSIIQEGASLSDGLSLENDFSLEEIFYGRPIEASSLSSDPMEGSGENNSSLGSEAL
ncbi:MAG: biosynthetic peptidoglycan transglycosylase [Bdellovibrionota bacterium]